MLDRFYLKSPAFEDHGMIPERYTCEGSDLNPELHIHNTPEEAKSLALIMDDPDAPTGVFTHWLIWNISPEVTTIKVGEVPEGARQGITSFHKVGYGGPCPPTGKSHRYYFRLFALDRVIDLPESAHREDLERLIQAHVIGRTELLGTYKRESVLY